MALKVNKTGVSNANSLIAGGKVNAGAWSFSGEDGDKLLGTTGDNWAEYKKWFLAIDPDADPETKAAYKYPFGKGGEVYRKGIIAAKSRAAQQGLDDVESAADTLLQKIDKDKGDMGECDCDMPNNAHTKDCPMYTVPKSNDRADLFAGEKRLHRIDNIEMPYYMVQAFKPTTEGFLKGRAIVTSIGVFQYKYPDGTMKGELRLPEEVFAFDSLESLKLKPLTNDHPPEKINSENIKQYQVGNVGDNPGSQTQWNQFGGYADSDDMTDGLHVAIDLIVQDAAAASDVVAGKRALSCGYECSLEPAEPNARYLGMPYDFIQRRIRYNHVAIVDAARAGDAAQITFDRLDSAESTLQHVDKSTQKKKEELMLKKVKIDNMEFDAEETVITTLNKETQRADTAEAAVKTLTTDKSTLEGERDGLKDKLDKAETDLKAEQAKSQDATKLDAAISARLDLYQQAAKVGVAVKNDKGYLSESDIKKSVILKANPKATLDGKDEGYIQGRFEAALDMLAVQKANNDSVIDAVGGGDLPNFDKPHSDDVGLTESEKAKLRMDEDFKNRWKTPAGTATK